MSKFTKVKVALQKLLLQFGEIATDKGNLEFAGEELAIGAEVFIEDVAAPDGDYETENRIIVVVDGVVTDIKEKEPAIEEPEVEVEAEEKPVVEEPSLEDSLTDVLTPLVDEIKALKSELDLIKGRLQEIEDKLLEDSAKPADEEFKEVKKSSGFWPSK